MPISAVYYQNYVYISPGNDFANLYIVFKDAWFLLLRFDRRPVYVI